MAPWVFHVQKDTGRLRWGVLFSDYVSCRDHDRVLAAEARPAVAVMTVPVLQVFVPGM